MKAGHRKHTVEEEARNREAAPDRTIEESFPRAILLPPLPNPEDDQHDFLDYVDERHEQEDRANRR